jgi:hypothetical protein
MNGLQIFYETKKRHASSCLLNELVQHLKEFVFPIPFIVAGNGRSRIIQPYEQKPQLSAKSFIFAT